ATRRWGTGIRAADAAAVEGRCRGGEAGGPLRRPGLDEGLGLLAGLSDRAADRAESQTLPGMAGRRDAERNCAAGRKRDHRKATDHRAAGGVLSPRDGG